MPKDFLATVRDKPGKPDHRQCPGTTEIEEPIADHRGGSVERPHHASADAAHRNEITLSWPRTPKRPTAFLRGLPAGVVGEPRPPVDIEARRGTPPAGETPYPTCN